MKQTLLLLLSIPTLLFSQSNTLCSVNEEDMGTWAFMQHSQFSEKIIQSINIRSVQIYETEKLKMSEKKMSEKLYNLITVFIQTDMNNPEIGKDSVMGFFKEEFIKSFKTSKDFFEFNDEVDWIISNPPFSKLNDVLEHTLKVCKKGFCYIMGVLNLTNNRVKYIKNHGFNLTFLEIANVKEWHLFSCCVVIFQKDVPSIKRLNYEAY
jgi:hypothetical protein